tara:strand:+ start:251 stop:523 length:273 start_codon:yes stop_codon:yes gene_type:complete
MNDNKIIAEFMGIVYPMLQDAIVINCEVFQVEDLKYHTSWDWLIPVVAKCTELNDDEFDNQGIAWALLSDSIIDAYDHVIEFIKTYNDER